MPVILAEAFHHTWLAEEAAKGCPNAILDPLEAELMTAWELWQVPAIPQSFHEAIAARLAIQT